jgi:hypothetical protein
VEGGRDGKTRGWDLGQTQSWHGIGGGWAPVGFGMKTMRREDLKMGMDHDGNKR